MSQSTVGMRQPGWIQVGFQCWALRPTGAASGDATFYGLLDIGIRHRPGPGWVGSLLGYLSGDVGYDGTETLDLTGMLVVAGERFCLDR